MSIARGRYTSPDGKRETSADTVSSEACARGGRDHSKLEFQLGSVSERDHALAPLVNGRAP